VNVLSIHLNQIGDLLFSLPALKCMRNASPSVRITAVVRDYCVPLVQMTELVDDVIVRTRGQGLDKLRLRRDLSHRDFDLAITFSRSLDCMLLARSTRAPIRAGFHRWGAKLALNKTLLMQVPPSTSNNLRLIEHLGFETTATSYVGLVKPADSARQAADGLLQREGVSNSERLVVISAVGSAKRSVKNWTDQGFAEVAIMAAEKWGMTAVVVGTERPDSLLTCAEGRITDLTGKTNLQELAAVLARADVVVGVDSGVIHLAAAVGTRVVGLYGPSDPSITGPQGVGHAAITAGADCSPCFRTYCRLGRKCMTEIKPADVISAVEERLPAARKTKS
jgi:heptosyltransferase I